MFLTPEELRELTDSPRKDRQIQWLMDNGMKFARSLAGRPKVLQAEIERVMLGGSGKKTLQPDFNKLNA